MNIPQEQYIKIGPINTRYLAEGEGSPLVLVHGMGGSANGWLLSFGPFTTQHRVYALDLIGHGRTGQLASGFPDGPTVARFVKDFMTELGIGRAHVAGHSLGGAVSLHLAIEFPEIVDKLVLVDSAGLGKEAAMPFRVTSLPLIGEWLTSQAYKPDFKKYADGVRSSSKNASYITDELIENLYQVEREPAQAKVLLKALRAGANWRGQKKSVYGPIVQRLSSISSPTLVIWGQQDDVVPLSHGEFAARSIPNARLEVIDHCGHVPMFDQPEIFNRLVLEFLKE